jgi:hypothetical protein
LVVEMRAVGEFPECIIAGNPAQVDRGDDD